MTEPLSNGGGTSRRQTSTRPRPPGLISVMEVYQLSEALARLGWTASSFRAAKRRGLKVIVCGKRRYLTGKEIVRFLESQ